MVALRQRKGKSLIVYFIVVVRCPAVLGIMQYTACVVKNKSKKFLMITMHTMCL